MPDFENDMHLTFPDKKIWDYSEINWNSKISDKTKRDEYFKFEDDSQWQFEWMRWK